ncbi:MAG: peptidoglycan-binding domain-containing protein [Pseudorhodobacter sp.]|nr:peptidoglycan-binding domain-containing protein [Pseudorhodobacter sp.]
MKLRKIASACLIGSMAMAPAAPVLANSGDVIGGLIVGGILGAAIANDANRNKKPKPANPAASSTSSSSITREANREVQTALNYFGYPVGTPDGVIGPKSRSAISQYQVLLGDPATGQLTEYERTILVTAYQRALAGGPLVAQTVATSPLGTRGMLVLQRDEMAGLVAPTGVAPVGVLAAPVPAAEPVPAPSLPVLAAEPAAPSLPSFMGSGVAQVSLASQCNKISLMTNTNGGYTTAALMTDANFALAEQFCLARTYAMATSEDLTAKVAGFTPQQVAEQCSGFGPVLKDHVAALSMQPSEQVLAGVSGFVLSSGMAPAQLAGTAKICLGVGYTTDAMDVAIGSALLLTALGEKGYGELLGHHLSQGFGAAVRPDLALGWYEMGLAATQAGASIFAPGLPDRSDLIRKAAYTISGHSDLVAPVAPLPVFAAAPTAVVAEQPAPTAPAPVAELANAQDSAAEAPVNGATVVSFISGLLH